LKVALIGDVHANVSALEAVLQHAHGQRVEAIWNVGDFVGYGASPNEVIQRLRQEHAVSIVGNYDRKALRFKEKQKKWRKKKQSQKFLAFQWAHHTLTEENRRYLSSLPRERALQVEGLRVLLTHGSPVSEKEHLTPATPEKRLHTLASMVEADLVICGHSHRPFTREVDRVRFINTGSVGRPDDGDPRASYAVLEAGDNPTSDLEVHHHRVAYDVEGAVAGIRRHDLPEAFAQMLIQGYALDDVTAVPQAWDAPPPQALPWAQADKERRLEAVQRLADSCDYEEEHTHHVTELSIRLFDELQPLHRFGAEERFMLRCGALLHDIGWVEGRKAHHKTSLRLIMEGLNDAFSARERRIVASIARYHRGAHPKGRHHHLAALAPVDQYRVTVLAGLLRVADGLDRTHRNVVQGVSCDVKPQDVTVTCEVRMYPGPERDAALEKGRLLERALDRELVISWRLV